MTGSFGSWSDSDTLELRSLANALMPETVVVSRRTDAPDGVGGATETWATTATVPGRVHQVKRFATEAVQGGVTQLVQRWEISLPAGTDVLPQDRLVVGGYTYEVADAPDAVLSFEARTKVSCVLVV